MLVEGFADLLCGEDLELDHRRADPPLIVAAVDESRGEIDFVHHAFREEMTAQPLDAAIRAREDDPTLLEVQGDL